MYPGGLSLHMFQMLVVVSDVLLIVCVFVALILMFTSPFGINSDFDILTLILISLDFNFDFDDIDTDFEVHTDFDIHSELILPMTLRKEKDGSDGPVQTLRWCLQKAEKEGMVDFQLSGHTAERPPQVFNGGADDQKLGIKYLLE